MKKDHYALSIKHYALYFCLMAVVVACGLSLSSCSDDDDEDNSTEQRSDVDPLDTDEARVAWRWLCVLTDAERLDANWKSKTYEPTVGQASENNEYTRLIVVSDLDDAKNHFSRLADMEPSELYGKVTVDGGAAGTMVWEPSKAGAENLAVVDVKSRIMPHLQRIVYCTQEQIGQNGWFSEDMKGTPYYRLGDVIRDKDGYYWICVCPAFTPKNEKDCYWVNVYNARWTGYVFGSKKGILKENIKDEWNQIKKYDNKTILLPTQLPYDRMQIFNLSQLLWAIINTESYKQACLGNAKSGLCGYPYTYHGEKYVSSVATYWDETKVDGVDLWRVLFGFTMDQMRDLNDIAFFYQGYKWWWGTTADMWRFKSNGYVAGGYAGKESGDKESIEVVANGFDINRYAGDEKADSTATGGPVPFQMNRGALTTATWVVRCKKGKDLYSGDGKYSPHNKIEGCTDIYRYNEKENIPSGANNQQDNEDTTHGYNGIPYYKIGDVYKDANNCTWFVIESAGNNYNTRDANSQYSYLISFDGIQTTANGDKATNLPSKEMAIKAMLWLDLLASQSCVPDNTLRTSIHPFKRAVWNIISQTGIDFRKIFHFVMPRDGRGGDEATHLACVGYRTDDGQQRVLRFLNECENVTSIRMSRFYFWEHYRDFANEYNPYYQQYTNDIVYLSDINNAQKVTTYGANDPYSKQPFVNFSFIDMKERTGRTQTDARSLDVRNYFYQNGRFVTDASSMWNEPVLFFRVAKVLDKGESHSATTTDGIRLTQHAAIDWGEDYDDDNEYSNTTNGFEKQWGMTITQTLKDVYLDGRQVQVKSWKTIQ